MPPSVTSHLLLFHSPPSFSLTRRPPTPPLFPYTTLFRSRLRAQNLRCVLAAGDTFRAAAVQQLVVWGERVGCDVVRGKDGADPGRDRKSTRLNSSHVKISYAVFCLKKKTNENKRRDNASVCHIPPPPLSLPSFFLTHPPPPHPSTLSLHDALPISTPRPESSLRACRRRHLPRRCGAAARGVGRAGRLRRRAR